MEFFKNHKGAIATLLGLFIAVPVNVYAIIFLFSLKPDDLPVQAEIVEKYFTWLKIIFSGFSIMNLIAIVWFILPSKIEISGKIINIKLED